MHTKSSVLKRPGESTANRTRCLDRQCARVAFDERLLQRWTTAMATARVYNDLTCRLYIYIYNSSCKAGRALMSSRQSQFQHMRQNFATSHNSDRAAVHKSEKGCATPHRFFPRRLSRHDERARNVAILDEALAVRPPQGMGHLNCARPRLQHIMSVGEQVQCTGASAVSACSAMEYW